MISSECIGKDDKAFRQADVTEFGTNDNRKVSKLPVITSNLSPNSKPFQPTNNLKTLDVKVSRISVNIRILIIKIGYLS